MPQTMRWRHCCTGIDNGPDKGLLDGAVEDAQNRARRDPYADAFDALPPHARALDGIGLGLMVIVVGLLIAPGPYHRIVEGGADSGSLHELVTEITDLALLPFALAIGINVFLAAERVFGGAAAIAA